MTNERLGVSAAELDDLDLPRLEAFVASRGGGGQDAAVKLGLLSRSSPRLLPTVCGLYLFGKLPQVYFPEWGVVCMASAGATLAEPVAARSDLEGSLEQLVKGALAFVDERTGGAEALRSEYPSAVVRESIVNALVHRDLRKASRVAVRLFVDRLEIWSPGGPPEGISDLEELAREGGISQPRNPVIASIGRMIGLGEQLGRGLHLLVQADGADDGSPLPRPEIRASQRDVTVVLPSRWRRPRGALELS